MKEDHSHQRKKFFSLTLTRAAFFLFLFLLGYAFGHFSASTTNSSHPPPPIITTTINPPTTTCLTHEAAIPTHRHQPPTLTSTLPPPHDLFQFRTECAPPLPHHNILPTILSKIFNNTSPYSNFPPPYAAPYLHRRRIRGWGSTAPVFRSLISSVRPPTIIEVGTFLGASALHMANLTRALGLDETLILCLDDFRGWPGFRDLNGGLFRHVVDVNGDVVLMQQFMQNVVDAGEEGRVVPVPFSTAAGLEAMCEWGVYGDLVEVDAGHDFHSAWADINRAWAVVRPGGGVMFGHDYNQAADNRGVRRAVDLFAKVKGLRVEPNGQHWVLWPPKPLSTSYSSSSSTPLQQQQQPQQKEKL